MVFFPLLHNVLSLKDERPLFLSCNAFPHILPRNSSNITGIEKPFLSPHDESQDPSTAQRKDTSLLVLLKEISLSCSFQKRKIEEEHTGLLLEGILFPFSSNKFIKQLKFCLVITASGTTCPQKCSVNFPPQDQYPCCRHLLLCISIPAPAFMYRSKYPYGYLPSRPFNSCWDKLCRVLSNSSSFLVEGIPAYASHSQC